MINAFTVGVDIVMSSNSSGILATMLRELELTHDRAKELFQSMGGLQRAAIGAVGAFAGFTALKAIGNLVLDARKLNDELEKTIQLGGDFSKNIDRTRLAAFNAANEVRTLVPDEGVKMSREAALTLNHPGQGDAMLPEAAKAAYVISHYTGEDQDGIIKNLIRIADDRGQVFTKDKDGNEVVDAKKLTAEFEAAAKSLILAGGMTGGSAGLLAYARQAGPAAKTQSAESFYAAGQELAVMLGSSKLGTAEMGLFQQFIGGKMTKEVADGLTAAGLLKPSDWHEGKSGGVVVNPGAANNFDPMIKDPAAYFSTGEGGRKIQAYAEKEGITAIQAVFKLFGRQTVVRLVSDIQTNRVQIERARKIFKDISDVAAEFDRLMKNDLTTNILAFTNAWTGLTEALGEAGIPLAIKGMTFLSDAIHMITNEVVRNPDAANLLLKLSAAVAALITAAGIIAVGEFVVSTLLIRTGMTNLLGSLVGFAVGTPAAAAFGTIASGLGALGAAILTFGASVALGYTIGQYFLDPKGDDGKRPTGVIGGTVGFLYNHILGGNGSLEELADPRGRTISPGQYLRLHPAPSGTASDPHYVAVTNPQAIGQAAAAAAKSAISNALGHPDAGPTAADTRNAGPFGGFGGSP